MGIEIAQAERMPHLDAKRFGSAVDGGGLQLLAASGGAWRLGVGGGDLVPGLV